MYREKKEERWHFWGVFFGPFVGRMCAFYPKKKGECWHFWGGSFSARLSTACAFSTPKRGEVPAIFVLVFLFGPFVDRMCTFYPLKGGKC